MTQSILHYEIIGPLGSGGMGVVYKARDARLERFVALKFLPPHLGADDVEGARFLQEARAASTLDHPNICTIHDIEKAEDGRMFIVMACYEGETLRARMQRGALPVAEAVSIARQVACGLGRAHERGIVHRDVKPANIFVTTDGTVKLLDFGIARLTEETHLQMTRAGTTLGTVGYMAPEQARGEPVDARADVWAIGVILYEMVTGRRAFDGTNTAVILNAIQSHEPLPVDRVRSDVPPLLADLVARALKKDPAQRFPDARALATSLAEIEAQLHEIPRGVPAASARRLRPLIAVPVVIALLSLVSFTGWLLYQANRSNWARNKGLPAIARAAAGRNYGDAVALAERVEQYIPDDPVLRQLWSDIAVRVRVESNPQGAVVEVRPYAEKSAAWRRLGTTPIDAMRMPKGTYRWRFSAAGAESIERAATASNGVLRIDLPPEGSVPDGFVRVDRSSEALMLAGYGLPQELTLNDFLIQRYEVTNRDYRKFVDAGGYRRREFWKQDFKDKDRTLTWDEAMSRFRDKAGQPGPATWEVGYAVGQDDMPVGGLSWYEAAAYAEFAGLRLPTIAHWFRAAGLTAAPFLIPLSNFDYRGPLRVGQSGAMSPSGVFDMAGNVKEWVWNANLESDRYILGGGWSEPTYLFGNIEARSPFDRSPQNGVRYVKYSGNGQPDGNTAAPFSRVTRDYRRTPVSDETFATFVRLLEYSSAPLAAVQEKVIDANPEVRVERVSFTAAYPEHRVVAYLWLPKGVKPPYQTIVVFPGAEALTPATPGILEQPDRYDFLVRSGRAVIHPVYYGMYERFVSMPTVMAKREASIRWVQDVRRTLDYLESRDDIDRNKIGYLGASLGGGFGPVSLAIEPRLKLAVLLGAGLAAFTFPSPDVEPANYAPRVKQPVLMVCGRYDYFIPYEPAQTTFFRLIGTASADKKHVVVDAPHAVPRSEYLPHVLGWLDKYFGPAR